MKEMVGGCCVCSDERGWAENPLVYCDGHGCNVAVHQACYGIVQVPTGPWFCRKCESQERAARVKCELCPQKDGALKRTDSSGWCHVVCALFIPEAWFANVQTMEPIVLKNVPPERFNKLCYVCEENGKEVSKAMAGACMQCNKNGCKMNFHVTCAQAQGLLCEEAGNYGDNVKYCGYCHHHYKKLKKDANIKIIPAFKPIPSDNATPDSTPEKMGQAKDAQMKISPDCKPRIHTGPSTSEKTISDSLRERLKPNITSPSIQSMPQISSSTSTVSTPVNNSATDTSTKNIPSNTLSLDMQRVDSPHSSNGSMSNQNSVEQKLIMDARFTVPGELGKSSATSTVQITSDTAQVGFSSSTSVDSGISSMGLINNVQLQSAGTSVDSDFDSTQNVASKAKRPRTGHHNYSVFGGEPYFQSPISISSLNQADCSNSLSTLSALASLREGAGQSSPKPSQDHQCRAEHHPEYCNPQGLETTEKGSNESVLIGPPKVFPSLLHKSAPPGTNSDFPASMEQLLERQWEHSSQFLMEQGQHFDIASLLNCLHQLKSENGRLEDYVKTLVSRRDHLLAVNARLSLPYSITDSAAVASSSTSEISKDMTKTSSMEDLPGSSIHLGTSSREDSPNTCESASTGPSSDTNRLHSQPSSTHVPSPQQTVSSTSNPGSSSTVSSTDIIQNTLKGSANTRNTKQKDKT
ncbi:hypothetical protein ACJMK2_024386 [Sinanodonta woodiana]|uniref:Protein AF-10 n=1 Tax=Sinanodonta woodiana TaxID=1069815 RepID=A0ABD3T769_SINWO